VKLLKKIKGGLVTFGINLPVFCNSIRGLPFFIRNYHQIRAQMKESSLDFPILGLIPCSADRFRQSGFVPMHYFYQDVLIAHKIFQNRPAKHVDIGSRIDGFVAHVASFTDIEVCDIRLLHVDIDSINFKQMDIMQENSDMIGYCDLMSCLHAMEHFGLGRYGDTVNYEGHLVAWRNMAKMLKKEGLLYFSVPIGKKQGIYFDAHRVFSLRYLLELIQETYSIESFSYVDDDNRLHEDVQLTQDIVTNSCGCYYGCGIFVLMKL